MKTVSLEIRDRGTRIMALAIRPGDVTNNTAESVMASIVGYGKGNASTLLLKYSSNEVTYNPYDWNDRTMHTAHKYIEEHFDLLKDGDVVDVEFILEETDKPKEPEWKNYLGGF